MFRFLGAAVRQTWPLLLIAWALLFAALYSTAAGISQSAGLLSSDALFVAIMQQHGLTKLASGDGDFDRVPGITRHAPL